MNDSHLPGGRSLTGILVFAFLCLFILTFAHIPVTGDDEVRVAVLLPLTGNQSALGIEQQRGIELALDGINPAFSAKFAPVYYDTEGNPEKAAECFRDACSKGISVCIGPILTTELRAVAPIADEEKVVVISPCATFVNEKYDYVYRVESSDTNSVSGMSFIILNLMEDPKVAILYGNSDYSYSMKDFIIESLHESCEETGSECSIEPILIKTPEDAIDKLVLVDPDIVLVISEDTQTNIDVFSAASEKIPPNRQTWIATESAVNERFPKEVGSFSEHACAIVSTRKISDPLYMKKYKESFGESSMMSESVFGYEAMMLVKETVNSRGTNSEMIKKGLDNIKYVGLTGAIVFTDNGERWPIYDVMVVESGKWVYKGWDEVIHGIENYDAENDAGNNSA